MHFGPTWYLFEQEAHLIHTCLAQGLTSLRNADPRAKGGYYTAFFHLSVGFERLMKIILILHHMTKHDLQTPQEATLKNWSHGLIKQKGDVDRVAKDIGVQVEIIDQTSTKSCIFQLLSNFATSTRYANLNGITGRQQANPLAEWAKILWRIWESEVPANKQKSAIAQSEQTALMYGDAVLVQLSDMQNRPLSLEGAYIESQLQELASPYAIWHLMEIIIYLFNISRQLCYQVNSLASSRNGGEMYVPILGEDHYFVDSDKKRVLRKKRWK